METQHTFRRAREAARALNRTASERIDRLLLALADAVEAGTEELLAANARDRSRMNPADPAYDRLLLDRGRLLGIAADLRNVAALPSPLGRILDRTVRPNGMEIRKISVPFGVVGVIYEARPNVGFDVFALCVKSGNACILKGGSDARDSNAAIAALIRRTLAAHGFDENTLALLPPTHEATAALLGATGLVDLVIPRGGRGLIDFVRDHARVPVIETGAGVCHAYFDRSGDTEKGAAIVLNAKTRRVSVCNALDTLVVHRDRLTDLPRLCRPLAEKGVELQADEAARTAFARELSRSAAACGQHSELRDGVSLPAPFDPHGRLARRGARPHRPLLLAAQRDDHSRRRGGDPHVPARSRRRLRLRQRLDGLHRRRAVRHGRRDRNQYAETPRARADGAARTDLLQIPDRRRRADAAVAPPSDGRQKNDPKFCFPEIKSYICSRRVIEK